MPVREASPADVDELVRLRARWRGVDPTTDFSTAFRHWFHEEQPTRAWWIAEHGGRTCGMVNVKLFERMPSPGKPARRWGYLANLFVEPEARGQGVGASLVQAAIDFAQHHDLVRLVLAPSELSVPLYRRLGFRSANELMVLPLQK
ncbi:MAG: hypothetical protein JWO22_1057 [Frankiales bacterium]|nr:hypothetical protein [Frankiales bacterium]